MPFKFQLGANRVIQVAMIICLTNFVITCYYLLSRSQWSFAPDSTIVTQHFVQGYEKGVPGMCRSFLLNRCAQLIILLTMCGSWIMKVEMCRGETRTLLVPPEMGYGERGVPNVRSFIFLSIWPQTFEIKFSPQASKISFSPPDIWVFRWFQEALLFTSLLSFSQSAMDRHCLALESYNLPESYNLSGTREL